MILGGELFPCDASTLSEARRNRCPYADQVGFGESITVTLGKRRYKVHAKEKKNP
jgi:hypothetical protein